ncbi:hypothetical protein GMMP13_1120002 [Candidatus Magnetomoraceae bacterium gMMP-13]
MDFTDFTDFMASKKSEPYKIGVFGWTGTGKTTFLSMLYYLLNMSKIPGVSIAGADHLTNSYLLSIIDDIANSTSWKELSSKIVGSLQTTELFLNVSLRNKKFAIQINDYRGEDVEVNKKRDIISNYLMQCDGLLIFIALTEAHKSRLTTFHRKNEFNVFLANLVKLLKKGYIDIPITLVVTKYDNVSQKTSSIEKLIEDNLSGEIITLQEYCKQFDIAVISSKECFDYYVLKDTYDDEFPDFNSDEIDSKNISIPFIQLMVKVLKNIRQKKLKPIKLIAFSIISLIILIYSGLLLYTYYDISHIDNMAASSNENKYIVYQAYATYYSDSKLLPLFPFIEKELKYKIDKFWILAEAELYKNIKNVTSDYNRVIELSGIYFNHYSNGQYIEEVTRMYNDAEAERARYAYSGGYSGGGGGCFIETITNSN